MEECKYVVGVTISDELIKTIKRTKLVYDTLGHAYEINDMKRVIKNIDQLEPDQSMERIHIIVDNFVGYMSEVFQQLNEAIYQLSLCESMRAIQSYADEIQKMLEIEAECIERDNLRQNTKALYKRNIKLQNRQYNTQIKLARKQTIKANRPQIIRRLP